ncbi:hypothetical protein AB0L00_38290 [Actinoallomurus sp. NPDC052308]|uniref:hypothetical protein n=1 Tax=Actinoallomurus sp. NPDC052308 TaxID=3155530 RepID=UPI0034381748
MDFAASAQNAATDEPPAPGVAEEVDAVGLAVEAAAAVGVLVDASAWVGEVVFPADPPHPDSAAITLMIRTATADGRMPTLPPPLEGIMKCSATLLREA